MRKNKQLNFQRLVSEVENRDGMNFFSYHKRIYDLVHWNRHDLSACYLHLHNQFN